MQLLGIDWGESKIGLAIAQSPIAEPLNVLRYKDEAKLIKDIGEIIMSHNIEKIIVGQSEQISKQKAREFGEKLSQEVNIPVDYSDETLTTYQAQILSRQAGIKRQKRKNMEDAYAATVMLQDYLDGLTVFK
jgi:putative holliday junction resolvase